MRSLPMRRLCLALVFVVVTSSGFAQKPGEVESAILKLTNAHREKKKVPAFVLDEKLSAIAQAHARGMAKANKYGDNDNNGHIWMGKNPLERIRAAKYSFLRLAENVGYNVSKTPAETMVKTWITSKDHEENMANKEFTNIGIGAAKSEQGRWFFVVLFSATRESSVTIKVMLDNQTGQLIRFRIGTTKYEIPAKEKSTLTHAQLGGRARMSITWPAEKDGDKEKVEEFDLTNGATYLLKKKKDGGFTFEKKDS